MSSSSSTNIIGGTPILSILSGILAYFIYGTVKAALGVFVLNIITGYVLIIALIPGEVV